MLLLAPDVRDLLPEGHFAHHVSDLVDGLDLRAAPYEGDGHAPYEPRMMVKVLLYGYATGVLRGLARKLEEDVAFRVAGNSTARCASFAAGTWRSSRGCSWRWCAWRARRGF